MPPSHMHECGKVLTVHTSIFFEPDRYPATVREQVILKLHMCLYKKPSCREKSHEFS